jgi:hypothetical protein
MKSVLFTLVAILVVGVGAAAADPVTICFTARLGSGLGAARVDFNLLEEASLSGLFGSAARPSSPSPSALRETSSSTP